MSTSAWCLWPDAPTAQGVHTHRQTYPHAHTQHTDRSVTDKKMGKTDSQTDRHPHVPTHAHIRTDICAHRGAHARTLSPTSQHPSTNQDRT
eukprot:31384-Eustigmatos_ZCMA.PRE.1